jgi:hypothetical protein
MFYFIQKIVLTRDWNTPAHAFPGLSNFLQFKKINLLAIVTIIKLLVYAVVEKKGRLFTKKSVGRGLKYTLACISRLDQFFTILKEWKLLTIVTDYIMFGLCCSREERPIMFYFIQKNCIDKGLKYTHACISRLVQFFTILKGLKLLAIVMIIKLLVYAVVEKKGRLFSKKCIDRGLKYTLACISRLNQFFTLLKEWKLLAIVSDYITLVYDIVYKKGNYFLFYFKKICSDNGLKYTCTFICIDNGLKYTGACISRLAQFLTLLKEWKLLAIVTII